MSRTNRIALLAALVLLVLAAGSAMGVGRPSGLETPAAPLTDEHEEGTEADGAAHARERLDEAGIPVDDGFEAAAATYGVGGAVRLYAWAEATGRSVSELAALRDSGGPDGGPMGWGRLARELGVHPGIGSIMGRGNGDAPDVPPGQERGQDD